jgi:hypothetical protein
VDAGAMSIPTIARACKTVYPGSIPGVASSNFTDWLMMGCAGRKNFRRIATQIVGVCSYSVLA